MPAASAAGRVLRALAPVLRRFGDRWYLFGAQAAIIWGRPRLTGDVDVTAFLEPRESGAFVAAMRAAGFTLRVTDVEDFVERTRVLPFLHTGSRLALDVVLGGPGPEEEFARGVVVVDIEGTAVPVLAPEALVVTKILAGRPKDIEDVRGILRVQHRTFDVARTRRLLRMLERALDQSDLVPVLDAQLASTPRGRRGSSGRQPPRPTGRRRR